ncbi:MAG: translation initiation factor IF-2 [Gammaproteobacteria bacterium]|nr:translation initiation factor IF-2 [Gammaproteobacteria bacterium]
MVDVTVGQLAKTLKQEPDHLLKLMRQAGLPHQRDDEIVSDQQKVRFLDFVQNRQSTESTPEQQRKITIRRKNVSTLRTGKGGRGAAVKVETRRKKVFVRRTVTPLEAPRAPSTPSQAELEAERIRAEDVRRQEAEEEARQEAARKAEEEQRLRTEAEEREKAEAEARAAERATAEEAGARSAGPARAGKTDARGPGRTQRPAQTPDALARAAAEAAEKAQIAARAAETGNRRATGRAAGRNRDRDRVREADFGRGRRRELSMKQEGRRAKRRHLTVEKQGGEFERPSDTVVREVEVGDVVTVGELAQRMSIKAGEVIKSLMGMGVMATINQALDQDTAVLVVEELGHRVKLVAEDEVEQVLEQSLQVEGDRRPRPAVVTVMGHVDHGKTSLLDYIRNTRVVAGEAGGITQHIGAYHVETEHGNMTFIDTPGHAAFTAMRARGAKSTDVVILVVAADDGVMPQTEEAVNHARAAEVPIVVAVNKIDLEAADPERVRNELGTLNVIPEDWGGDTQFVDVSAETGQGIDALLEAVILQSELLELDAVPTAPGQGVVIESRLDRGRGPVATLLVQNGTLKRGDVVIAGQCFGRVRAMQNERGDVVPEAPPSIPVEMLGLNGTPDAGDEFSVVAGERQARDVAEFRAGRSQAQRHATQKAASLENMFAHLGQGEKRVLKLIIKADVRGSLEAIVQACAGIGDDEVSVNILGSGVGGITESDANMALTYGAAIFGFNTRADSAAKAIVERESIDLRYYSVIYELLDDIKAVLEGMLAPEVREEVVGMAEVRDVFRSPRYGQVAGCMVVEGVVARNRKIRVLRDNVVIFEGELESLRRFKDDVNEVRNGLECGIGVRNYNDVRAGDKIEVFESREIARALGGPPRTENVVHEQAV